MLLTTQDIQTSRPAVHTDTTDTTESHCTQCGEDIEPARVLLLKKDKRPVICLWCGEESARQDRRFWCVAPISNKAAYTLITDYTLLKQINPKRTMA
jgi:hypothetical protein